MHNFASCRGTNHPHVSRTDGITIEKDITRKEKKKKKRTTEAKRMTDC